MSKLQYKGYVGSCEVSVEDGVVYGKLLHIRDLVTYEAEEVCAIRASFESAVDDYLADCKEEGREPDRPFKGSFNVRIDPSLHRELARCAEIEGTNFNSYVSRVLAEHKALSDFRRGQALGQVMLQVIKRIPDRANSSEGDARLLGQRGQRQDVRVQPTNGYSQIYQQNPVKVH